MLYKLWDLIQWIGVANIYALVVGTISLFVYLIYITYMNVPIGYVMTVEDHVLILIRAFAHAFITLTCFVGVIVLSNDTSQKDIPQKDIPQKDTSQEDIPQEDNPQKDIPQDRLTIRCDTCYEERV